MIIVIKIDLLVIVFQIDRYLKFKIKKFKENHLKLKKI